MWIPPWDTDITTGFPYRISISAFFKLELILYAYPQVHYPRQWVLPCLWLSGFAFPINAFEEDLEENLCHRSNISDNTRWRFLHVRARRFLMYGSPRNPVSLKDMGSLSSQILSSRIKDQTWQILLMPGLPYNLWPRKQSNTLQVQSKTFQAK